MLRIIIISLLILSCSKKNSFPTEPKQDPTTKSHDWDLRAQKNVEKLLAEHNNLRWTQDELNHLQWVAKASLLLRGQKELSATTDDINHLKNLTKEQVVDLFLNTTDFYNSALDFSLYYIGFRVDPFLLEDQNLNPRVNQFSQTIFATQALFKNESFFKIFELYPPKYLNPLKNFDEAIYAIYGLQPPSQILKNNFEKRKSFLEILKSKINDFKKLDETQSQLDSQNICRFFTHLTNGGPFFILPKPSDYIGIDSPIYAEEMSKLQFYFDNYCSLTVVDGQFVYELTKDFSKFTEGLNKAFQLIDTLHNLNLLYDSSKYQVKTAVDYQTYKLSYDQLVYQQEFVYSTLTNSSTNMNRKRAAYMLKHFFCDDLTPVNVKVDNDHTHGVHGSNPSCYACHYKLDPMAGFFKNYGYFFNDFLGSQLITFDDFASTDLATYQKQWLKPDGKTWNIGYIQSTQFDHLNQYGESLEDLHKILQTTPEVKRCLVKRIFEYSTNPHQIFDPGFIDAVASDFAKENAHSPQQAFKNLFRKAALSQTFAELNPVASECYDLKQGVDPKSRPPCQVAHILETNCVKCHSSTSGKNSLDLSRWIDTGSGKMGFAHLDESTGLQINPKDTFHLMLDRLTTADEFDRMPPGDMNPVYRQILFQWLNQKIGE